MNTNDRFDQYVELIPFSTCHYWVGSLNTGGYGKIKIQGRTVRAHRFAYERHNGPIPPGLHVLHSCHTPCCVNPNHLRVGTPADNMKDMADAGRQAIQTYNSGGGYNIQSRTLTDEEILEIKASPKTQKALAELYNVGKSQIGRIKIGKAWPHIV
jgi:hypothetical protein